MQKSTMDWLWKDVQYGARSLRKNPAFTLIAIITLTLAIGATTAVFSVVNSVLLRPLPFKNPDELVAVWSRRPDNNKAPFSLPDYVDYRDQNRTFAEIAAFGNVGLSLPGTERTDRLQGVRVSANLFQLLGVNATVGRLILPQDDEPNRRHVVVLTHEFWQRRFAGDVQIVGKPLNLNGESFEVIGILPRSFSLPNTEADLAIPLAPDVDPLRSVRTSVNFLWGIARLKAGTTREQAQSDLSAIVVRQREQYGDPYLKKIGVNLVPLYDEIVGSVRTSLFILLGAVGLVLLMGCSNLAALSLTRASSRYREIAVKKALGASSIRLVAQLLTESLMLALIGGAGGLLLAASGVRALLSLSPRQLPRFEEIGVDLRVLAFALGASVLSAVIFGIIPAIQGAKAKTNSALRASSRGAGDRARLNRSRSILVITEVALCFVLLIGAGLLIQSFRRVHDIQPGFEPTDTFSVRLSLPKARYQNRAAVALFCDKLLAAIQVLPGVQEVGAVSLLPMSKGVRRIDFSVAGQANSIHDRYSAQFRVVTPGYFHAMKIPLLQGRTFSDHDNADSIPVALVNEAMARRLWPKGDVIGAHLNIDDNNTGPRSVEISGIVGNVKHLGLEQDQTLDIYIPIAQIHDDGVGIFTNSNHWVIRSTAEGRAVETTFLSELHKLDRDAAASDFKPLADYLSESVAPRTFSLRIVTIFSVGALLLALTGIYGVVSYTVAQRTPEIGIRLALGARRTHVFRLILGHGAKVVLLGLVLGLAGALIVTRAIRGLLFGVTPSDPVTFICVAVLLGSIALIACGIPALRATNVDPLIALRSE